MTRYRTIVADPPTPWLDDGDVALYHGDVVDTLRQLPAGIAQTCITSPPYWGLRDYQTGSWMGGDPDCDHLAPLGGGAAATGLMQDGRSDDARNGNAARVVNDRRQQYRDVCGRCGARRVDSQLGLEATPTLYVERLVAVFREVWRVLRDDGTLWLNLGDSYASGEIGRHDGIDRSLAGMTAKFEGRKRQQARLDSGLKPKDLVGIPWKVAFALQVDGWYLRSDIIWSKLNPMPESVSDRPTKAHEYLFLLTKQPRYFYDSDAIREPHTAPERQGSRNTGWDYGDYNAGNSEHVLAYNPAGRNRRSVWVIPTEPFPEAHFATYPQALVRPCILAGTSERGECSVCGLPWIRVTEREHEDIPGGAREANHSAPKDQQIPDRFHKSPPRYGVNVETTGWRASCSCDSSNVGLDRGRGRVPTSGLPDRTGATSSPTIPQTVLDPFIGSGTTALVARDHGRRCIGIDLSEEYLGIAARRLQQLSLLADPA